MRLEIDVVGITVLFAKLTLVVLVETKKTEAYTKTDQGNKAAAVCQ